MSVGYALTAGCAYFLGTVTWKIAARDPVSEIVAVAMTIIVLTANFAFWTWWLS